VAAYWAFAVYAAITILVARGDDAIWAAWAVPAYGVAAVMVSRPRSRAWGIALLTAAFAVGAPLLLMLAQGDLAAGMAVIDRSATLLVRDGTPYLPAHQLSSWLAYDPYLPAMALFGLPSASGLQGAPAIRGYGWCWSPSPRSLPPSASCCRTRCGAARTAGTTCCGPRRSRSPARCWR